MTYLITFKRGNPKTITLRDIVAVDYYNGILHYSDGNTTYSYGIAEIETAERVEN